MKKTLDEVIDDFEKACDLELRCENCSGCLSQENGCPYDGAESVPDVLHYLKEYRSDKVKWEADLKSFYGFYVVLKYWAEQRENPPLTWDELRGMQGKPVWVEGGVTGYWDIVISVTETWMHCVLDGWRKETHGTEWQAYKRARE